MMKCRILLVLVMQQRTDKNVCPSFKTHKGVGPVTLIVARFRVCSSDKHICQRRIHKLESGNRPEPHLTGGYGCDELQIRTGSVEMKEDEIGPRPATQPNFLKPQ